ELVEPPTHEEIVSFIKELGYRGEVESITEMHIDHMSHPWRTFASIINRCLFGKVTAFDQLQLTRAQILWTIAARRLNMPYPRFTKAIIQPFISKDKTISMRNNMFMHGVKNDSVLGFTKFISKYEIRQVYGMLILDVLVSKEMMESKTYKTYLDFAIGKVIPKEARKRTKAQMKETSLTADDNIISEDPDTALELAKSISRTKAEEQEATRLVHETHERLVTEQPTWRKRQTGVTIRDTPTVTKKKTPAQPLKLKGMEMLLDAAIPAGDIKKAIKARAGSKPKVPDVSKAMSSDQESENGSWGESEEDDDHKSDDERTESDNDTSINLNKTDSKEEPQGDEFVHTFDDYVHTDDETQDVDDEEYVRINEELYSDVYVEMKDAEPADKDKGNREMTDAKKVETGHKEINQDVSSAQVQDEVTTSTIAALATQKEKTEAPSSSSSRSVSSNYGSIFLNLDNIYSAETEIMSMSDVQKLLQQLYLHSFITLLLVVVVDDFDIGVENVKISDFGKDDRVPWNKSGRCSEFIKEHFVPADVIEVLKQQRKPQKSAIDIHKINMEHATKQQESQYTIKSSDKAALNEFDQK
nr:hypothetical protein [Tanacetum cinerariifolium]